MSNDDRQVDRITRWLADVQVNDAQSISSRRSAYRTTGENGLPSKASGEGSDEADFQSVHTRHPIATEYTTAREEPRTLTSAADGDAKPVNEMPRLCYTPSVYSGSVPDSVQASRMKALGNLSGSTTFFGRQMNQDVRSEAWFNQKIPVEDPFHRQSGKHISRSTTNNQSQVNRGKGREARDSKQTVAASSSHTQKFFGSAIREEVDTLLPYQTEEETAALLEKDTSDNIANQVVRKPIRSRTKSVRPGPASVTRNSAGKLQLERCKDGRDHKKQSGGRERHRLAKYFVGNYY